MAISDTTPPKFYTNNGQTVFPFNIRETQVTDAMTVKSRTQYEYDEARVDGEVTREKIIRAQIAATLSIGDEIAPIDGGIALIDDELEDEIALINDDLVDPAKDADDRAEYQALRAEDAKMCCEMMKKSK